MATHVGVLDYPAVSAADYSANQYHVMKLASGKATLCSVAGENSWGILQDDPAAADRECSVRIVGTSKAVASAAIAEFAPVTCTAAGTLVTATVGTDAVIGCALEAATAAGDIIEIDIFRQWV